MGNCGCGGRNALVVINSKVKNYPKPVYLPIIFSLENTPYNDFNQVLTMDLEYCERYKIGVFFNIDESKQIFYDTFKKECEKSFNDLNSLIDYSKYIKKSFPKEVNYDDIDNFVHSNNILKIENLKEDELNNHLIYCNNNIIRIGLYHKKLKDIELSINFLKEHPNKEVLNEEYIKKCKRIIELDVYRTYPSKPISYNNIYSCNFKKSSIKLFSRNEFYCRIYFNDFWK